MSTKERKHPAPPRYDEAFKAGAVRMVTEQGGPAGEVAAELGICIDTLRSWLKAAGAPSPGQADRQNRDARRLRELEAEIRALRKKLEEKDGVIDILKIRRHTFQTIEDKYRYIRTARAGPLWNLYADCWRSPAAGITNDWAANLLCAGSRIQELKRRLLSLHQRYPALGLDSLYYLIRPQLSCSRKRIHPPDEQDEHLLHTQACPTKPRTNSRHAHPIAPNLLARCFSFDKPDTAWVGDITYIPTGEGWLYCAVVKDLCTKQDRRLRLLRPHRHKSHSRRPRHGRPAPQSLCPASSSFRPRRPIAPPTLTVSVSPVSASGKACPARAIPMTTPWLKTSSAASSASASICAISPQGHMPWQTSSLISRPFTTQCARIPLLAGVLPPYPICRTEKQSV